MINSLIILTKNIFNKIMKKRKDQNEEDILRKTLIDKIKYNINRYTNIETLPAGSKDYYNIYKSLERYIDNKDDLLISFSIIKDIIDRLLFKIKVCQGKTNEEIIKQMIFINDYNKDDKDEQIKYIEGFKYNFL